MIEPKVVNEYLTVLNYSRAQSWVRRGKRATDLGMAAAEVIREGMTPQAATQQALQRIGDILAKYSIARS